MKKSSKEFQAKTPLWIGWIKAVAFEIAKQTLGHKIVLKILHVYAE